MATALMELQFQCWPSWQHGRCSW